MYALKCFGIGICFLLVLAGLCSLVVSLLSIRVLAFIGIGIMGVVPVTLIGMLLNMVWEDR